MRGLPIELEQKKKNCFKVLMAKEMGSDRTPIEFQTFYFSHVLVVPPTTYTHLPRPACHFRTPPNPLVTLSLFLIWVSYSIKSCVSIFLQNLWSLLLSCIGGHHQLLHIAPSPNGASVTRMEIKFDLSIPNRNERGTAMLVASRNILNPLTR